MIKQLILVGLGGSVGSMLRFLVSALTSKYFHGAFPFATFLVNLCGCLFIGLLIGLLGRISDPGGHYKLLLITGFCGGFTTFSTFANENLQLIHNQQLFMAVGYTTASVVLGVFLVWFGMWIVK